MMGEVWGEFIDPKEMARQLQAAMDLLASHETRLMALEEQINQSSIIATPQIGSLQPRNRRFNT